MNEHDAVEAAFNNGYEKGYADAKAKWIPVTERLPEHFGTFIVALKDMNGYCSTNAANYDYSQQRWRGLPMGARDEVTHWMPLPEQPKGE